MDRVNAFTCATWVPRGFAKENPDKVEMTKEDLQKLIAEAKQDLEDFEEDEYDRVELEEDEKHVANKENKKQNKNKNIECEMEEVKEETEGEEELEDDKEGGDFEKQYEMDNYDMEAETDLGLSIGKLVLHPSEEDDPILSKHKIPEEEDEDKLSEDENNKILATDNLIAAGHVDGDAAILEVFIYNSQEESFYVHHDILLPAPPLCMEWLNYDPSEEKPANMLAVGTMSNVIEIWELDLIDVLEPAYRLGKQGKKKKKIAGTGHKDAVLSLAWNKEYFHILASGSVDRTVILWDLKDARVDRTLEFNEKVQALRWHPTQPHNLLAGSCDGIVKLFDFREEDSSSSWKFDGEIECVEWNPTVNEQFLVSTDVGTVHCVDYRNKKPLWTIPAHQNGVTGLKMSPHCPGCLVTSSVDASIKIWDIENNKNKLIKTHNPKIGMIHTLTSCPDDPFVFFMGGDNQENNHKVLDIRSLGTAVRKVFCPRLNLPVDEDAESDDQESEDDNDDDDDDEEEETIAALRNVQISKNKNKSVIAENAAKGWKPKKSKFGKKKGGHLDKRKKRNN